jgi:hypothetical protein
VLAPNDGYVQIQEVDSDTNVYQICLNNWQSDFYPLAVTLTGISLRNG